LLQLRHFNVSLPFQYPFTIAKGTKTEQPALVVSLGFGKLTGWGEAPAINYYDVTVDGMAAALEKVRGVIERYSLTDPHRFWHFLHHLLPGQNFLIAALDIAGWDLFAQLRKQPLYAALGLPNNGPYPSDYTIGLDSAEAMVEKVKAHPASVYKIKMAAPGDIDLLRAIRAISNVPFRVDVNEGWNYEEALRLIPELEQLGVELIEQPLPKTAWEEMKELKAQSSIPLYADEACVAESDVLRCAAAFDGINIKLSKCGGITPAVRMITEARQLGLKIMLGSMNDSSIGTSAMLHLAGAVDVLDADGPLLLAKDNADGIEYEADGTVKVPEGNGLGIKVKIR
jgi:L-alanine-DL-glutamate epimerase-like enolase superfamily enzyme